MVAQFSQNDDPYTGNFVYLVSESGSRVSCTVHKDGSTENKVMCYILLKIIEGPMLSIITLMHFV